MNFVDETCKMVGDAMRPAYLIDGYNLLHAIGLLNGRAPPQGLETARDLLLVFLEDGFGTDADSLTIVYDSSRKRRRGRDEHSSIRILFAAHGQEADDVIEDLLAQDPQPRRLVIVSNDHRLLDAARQRGAQPMKCDAFLDVIERRRAGSPAVSPPPPAEKREQVSEQELRHWLKEFGDLQDFLDRQDPY